MPLAYALGFEKAGSLAKSLFEKFAAEQQQLATTQFEQLMNSVQIKNSKEPSLSDPDMPEPLKRIEPKYPKNAARKGIFGFTDLRFLIDEKGMVQTAEVVNSYPDNSFNKSSLKAIKDWKYEATGKKHIGRVTLSYSLGPLQKDRIENLIKDHKLFEYAIAGTPSYQYALGSLLELVSSNSLGIIEVDKSLGLASDYELPADLFAKNHINSIKIDGYRGSAQVKTDQQGYVLEVLKSKPLGKTELEKLLIGKKIDSKATSGLYSLYQNNSDKVHISKVITLSPYYSGDYWLNLAARNGNPDAQRLMAMRSTQWENYMLQQNDAQIQTWAGLNKILKGEKEQGQLLLEKAIAQHYELASELKTAL